MPGAAKGVARLVLDHAAGHADTGPLSGTQVVRSVRYTLLPDCTDRLHSVAADRESAAGITVDASRPLPTPVESGSRRLPGSAKVTLMEFFLDLSFFVTGL